MDARYKMQDTGCKMIEKVYPASCIPHPASCIWYPASLKANSYEKNHE